MVLTQAVERRPVLRGGPAQRLLPVGRDRDRERDRACERAREDDGGGDEPHRERDDERRSDERDGADRDHLVGAQLGYEPERGHERAEDAAGRRDREEATRRAPEALEGTGRKSDCDRRGRRENDARRPEQERRREQRIEPRPRVPVDDPGQDRVVQHGHERDEHCAQPERRDEQVRRRHLVGERAAGPVADRKTVSTIPISEPHTYSELPNVGASTRLAVISSPSSTAPERKTATPMAAAVRRSLLIPER